jgi:carboxylate-amine ligase
VRVDFTASAGPSLGVEWELALVDRSTGDLLNVADEVMSAVRDLHHDRTSGRPKIHPELLLNTIEVVTSVCGSVPEAMADLDEGLAVVRAVTDPMGVDFFCAGSHPFAEWRAQRVSEGERYATLIDRTQWWGRQMLIYGVHVHVGVTSAHKVLAILNGMLAYYPHLLALSASSPFWAGLDTGYVSNRALMFQQLPTAGLPFQFATWPQFEAYVGDMFTTGVVDDLKEIRWDLRPSPTLGTLETRVCDGLPTAFEVAALTALIHCLVVDLDRRLDAGRMPAELPPWHVQENKWRAARYGLEAIVILDADNRERLVTDDLADLLERLTPVARSLGCERELASCWDVVRLGSSAQRQRAVAAANNGDLHAVVASLVAEMALGPGAAPMGLNAPGANAGG